MDIRRKNRRRFKEKRNDKEADTYHKEAEISGMHNAERKLGEVNAHGTY